MSLLSKKTDTDSIKHEERLVRVKIRDTFFFRPPSPPSPPPPLCYKPLTSYGENLNPTFWENLENPNYPLPFYKEGLPAMFCYHEC